ncbi:MAG: hypothetical protein COT89_01090 [Candidatus Colwellbacteria bacterium CG10_big_fil_rev_8_21_14_0_10_42_22]|uniref:Uncharacterized protein n=1 Tax=Candidatus Colwellbacteria bacterium CG10_big_fil_rev_8_21_14_0_10_42_22 TaxID=1974540 RepID=A0A2H0VG83_9BACT|nr:MAG: hypothetical protein COT89_01090 [Candidatus Colwellbacteria bacterium CG10_big_fil_rev_8_21_14_0_10_42_22]
MKFNKKLVPIVALFAVLALTASSCEGSTEASKQEASVADDQLLRFLQTQPIPTFEWSQLRQNLIELETAQARTTQTTTFFFNMGIADPISSCASIGFPIAATYQLSNPEKMANPRYRDSAVIPQLEATGVYTADTTGTYVVCTAPSGKAYAQYWEGFVLAVTGPAIWQNGQVVLTGDPTFDFSVGQG